jgi:hypothetical protein
MAIAPTRPRSRQWLVALLVGLVVSGFAILIATSRPDGVLLPVPRLDSFDATVVAITGDRDGIGVERENGSHEGFAIVPGALEGRTPRRGDRVSLEVVYVPQGTFALSVQPAG